MLLRPSIALSLAAGLLLGPSNHAPAQQAASDDPELPGLVATYRDAKGNTAVRMDSQTAFHWGKTPPDARLTAGLVQATWQGRLLVQVRGEYRFYLFGNGEVELKVAGRAVVARQMLRNGWAESSAVTLEADFLPLELIFRQTEAEARLLVHWSGPGFGLEPIPPRFLYHLREHSPKGDFERGQLLARTLRCARCHGEDQVQPGPALDRLAGQMSREWLVRWLVAGEHGKPEKGELLSPRRMPAFGLSSTQAEAVADWLLHSENSSPPAREKPQKPAKPAKKGKAEPPKPDARLGERLFLTTGCLACHTWRDQGASGWLGGGDLTHIAEKRPAEFFADWLADPARLNADHRMPVFDLSNDERTALGLFLAAQKSAKAKSDFTASTLAERRAEGAKIVEQLHCAACHRLPSAAPNPPTRTAPTLSTRSNWDRSCLGEPDSGRQRPGYRLAEKDALALRVYHTSRQPGTRSVPATLALVEHNCLACHAREGTREAVPLLAPLLSEKLATLAQRYPDLAPQLPALTPPPLTSVGDKLTEKALADTITRRGEVHRPYLHVRMPRFPLLDEELHALVQHLVAIDRVPERPAPPVPALDRVQQDRFTLAGGRLVGSDGFGCTSCHQVGSVQPSPAQLNARGPDLSLLDRRMRRAWFDRWVRNPARIVPRMEMPSVQIPVGGVLDDQLDEQLAAVWHVLNQPGFEPPQPNPIRILRHHGHDPAAEPLLLTDVLTRSAEAKDDPKKTSGGYLIKPFLVGLANRHNVLLDLETARLALWSVGDAARQRTKGKTWFWELGGTPVLDPGITEPELTLILAGKELAPQLRGQFITEADEWSVTGPRFTLSYQLNYAVPRERGSEVVITTPAPVRVERKFMPLASDAADPTTGFAQELILESAPTRMRWRVLSPALAKKAKRSADGRTLGLNDRFGSRIVLHEPVAATFSADGASVQLDPDAKGHARVVLHYRSAVPVDRLPQPPVIPVTARPSEPVEVAPGFVGSRLPLPNDIMPTGLAWRPNGKLVFTSLKGQVYEAADHEQDSDKIALKLLADGLPAPYGVFAGPDWVDVSAKYALLRVHDDRRVETVASGWGYTHDYHDWAVGLPRNKRGEYFLGIPCQQDKRSREAARYHGNVLRLVPCDPRGYYRRSFTLQPVSAGHRFPMGLALDRNGELFVTDNQGNYNPFNELNHVRPGVHFGFINALDKGKPVPKLEPPAIDIPHPWTRSVNGICFLDTPNALRNTLGRNVFGPLEGHLIGCEYDTRRLVRMSLQRVGDTFQGAAYPLSIPPEDPGRGFLGPVVCAVSPGGELYVGSLRDSGWGAGNNVGEIVRVRVEPEKLPCGIAEVRAMRDGFVLDFFQPADRQKAGQAENYTIQSYRREATPAYGGPDLDRRTEKVGAVTVADDARRVRLRLAEMRPGFVYEFRLKNLAPERGMFYPEEAHYTLRVLPK